MRASLLTRLLAVSVLVAVLAIAATAWLAVRTTTGALEREQGRSLASDNQIYSTLLAYAATHRSWSGVGPTLETLAQHTDRRIALLAHDRSRIADTASGPLPSAASADVDPLAVNPALVPNAPADRIDQGVVGPFRLPQAERDHLNALAQRALNCVREEAGGGSVVVSPSGRPRVESTNQVAVARCSALALNDPTPTEQAALAQLNGLVNGCVTRLGLAPVAVHLDHSWTWAASGPAQVGMDEMVTSCLASARKEQLAPYVAPSALLFVTSTTGAAPSPFDLSAGNQVRIALAAAAVLVLTVAVTVLAGRRLTRPLRALTTAAERMRDGEPGARVQVRGKDEIARLATAFNDMSASRDRLERQRKDMVGDIAHELRTPLSNIRGWLEATEDGVSTASPELVTSLLEEAQLLQHIIDDLQDLALADAGTLRLHKSEVDVPELLTQVAAAHNGARVDSPPLTVEADPMRLRQMLGNLLSNAKRHTPDGGVITLRAHKTATEVVLEVADTGAGITPEDLPHVFDRFWRAEKSRSRATGGSGLGLAIVRKLAEAHGGTTTATSTVGVGSTFSIHLPAH